MEQHIHTEHDNDGNVTQRLHLVRDASPQDVMAQAAKQVMDVTRQGFFPLIVLYQQLETGTLRLITTGPLTERDAPQVAALLRSTADQLDGK